MAGTHVNKLTHLTVNFLTVLQGNLGVSHFQSIQYFGLARVKYIK